MTAVKACTPGEAWAPVSVEWSDDGLIVIRPINAEIIPAHVGAAIDAAGATLVVDARSSTLHREVATAGSVPPTATIFDPYWALTWLEGVYGPAVVEQVTTSAADPAAPPVVVDAVYGHLSDAVIRLAIATWLHRWWPDGNRDLNIALNPALLEIEIGALRWIAKAAFIEQDPIVRALRPHTDEVHRHYEWNLERARPGERQDLVEEVLLTALRAVVDTVPESTKGYEECLDLLTALEADDDYVPDSWVRVEQERQAALKVGVLMKGGALPSGAADTSPWLNVASGRATYDVREVPPRTLADVEDNVQWWIQENGTERRIVVSAQAAPTLAIAPEGAPLMARAFLGDLPVLFTLEWTPRDGTVTFEGAAPIPPDLPLTDAAVGVFHPAWAREARLTGAAQERAAGERREIIDILTDRWHSLGLRVAQAFAQADPSARPTAAEVLAQRRD